MNVLAIDTSGDAQVLGLRVGSTHFEKSEIAGRAHSRMILPGILELLAQARLDKQDLDAIVYGRGPGSFTGLRIAAGVVQGLAYGLDLPVVPVSTLACLAQGEYRASGATNVVVAMSARKQEVFFGSYRITDGIAVLEGAEGVHEAAAVPRQSFRQCAGVGSGWQFREKLEAALDVSVTHVVLEARPRAVDLLDLGLHAYVSGGAITAVEATPEYLREQVATRPKDRTS